MSEEKNEIDKLIDTMISQGDDLINNIFRAFGGIRHNEVILSNQFSYYFLFFFGLWG